MFKALPAAERDEWAQRAKTTAEEAKAEFKAAMEAPPSDDPSAQAGSVASSFENVDYLHRISRCIVGLPSFFQPIAEMVGAFTRLQLVVQAVGPMPQYGGKVHATT